MAARIAAGAAIAAVLVVAVVAGQLPRGVDGGVIPFDGTSTLGQWQCAVDEVLARQPTARFISYAALREDQIPCNRRGQSYYTNCGVMKQANPYTRGCSAITRCARNMN